MVPMHRIFHLLIHLFSVKCTEATKEDSITHAIMIEDGNNFHILLNNRTTYNEIVERDREHLKKQMENAQSGDVKKCTFYIYGPCGKGSFELYETETCCPDSKQLGNDITCAKKIKRDLLKTLKIKFSKPYLFIGFSIKSKTEDENGITITLEFVERLNLDYFCFQFDQSKKIFLKRENGSDNFEVTSKDENRISIRFCNGLFDRIKEVKSLPSKFYAIVSGKEFKNFLFRREDLLKFKPGYRNFSGGDGACINPIQNSAKSGETHLPFYVVAFVILGATLILLFAVKFYAAKESAPADSV